MAFAENKKDINNSIMKIKTSLVVISGCLAIFIFLMLPVFVSMEKKEKEVVKSFKGSSFSLICLQIGAAQTIKG